MRILLVEDNPGDVRLIQELLVEAGAAQFQITHAGRLSTGRQYLTDGDIDVILLDLSLPDSQGLSTLVQMHADAKGVPIVVLTGVEDEALGVKLVQAGAQDYLVKGQITGALLMRSLRYATERKRAEMLRAGQNRVLELLTTGSTLAEVLGTLIGVIEEQNRTIRCSILLIDAEGKRLRCGAAPSLPEDFTQAVDGLEIGPCAGSCGTAAYRREPVIVEDIATDPLWVSFSRLALECGLRASWSHPAYSEDGQVLGTFCMYCLDARGPTSVEMALIETGARMAGIAIERKRAEEELRTSETRIRMLLESTGEGIWGLDLEGRCTFINKSATEMLGYQPEEVLGKNMHALVHHTRADGLPYPVEECLIYRAFRTGQGCHVDNEVLWRRDGTAFPAEYSSYPILEGGVITGAVVAFTDITERKRAEKELVEFQEALRDNREALRALAARLLTAQEEERRRVSRELHDDLNQKLALLVVDVETLEHRLPPSPDLIRQQLRSLQDRVVKLSDDVRGLAYQLHPSILDDLGLVIGLQSFVADFATREGIEVRLTHRDLPEALPQDIATCLYRVTQESLRNIAKHACAPKAAISLTGSDNGILLVIKDFGVGFDLGLAKDQRSGLGIISMQERVRLVNGSFSMQSHRGHGTHVLVWIPLSESSP